MAMAQNLMKPAVSMLGKFGSAAIALPGWCFTRLVTYLVALATPPAFVLPPYHQPKSRQWDFLRRSIVIALIVFVGLIYGFLIAIFPLFLYTYLALPISFIALTVIWALPETGHVPDYLITRLFFAVFLTVCLWPNYLAFVVPGLPWMTMIRIWSFPLVLVTLLGLSTAAEFRAKMSVWFSTSSIVIKLLIGFVIIECLTLPMSKTPFQSLSRFLITQVEWTSMTFIAAFVFAKEGRAMLWAKMLCGCAVFLAASSIAEYKLGYVPWARHIPSFLVIQSELVQNILIGGSRAATGVYRIQSIFTTSLNFAEFLALTTAFIVHFLVTSNKKIVKALLFVYLIFSFWVIFTTDSRLGTVGYFASILSYVLFGSAKRWMQNRDSLIAPALVISYPVIFAMFMALTFVWRRLEVMVWGGGAQQFSTDARHAQWESGMHQLQRWPLGYGLGQAPDVVGYVNLAGETSLDSYYLNILIDFGILGFIAYFGMFLLASWQSIKTGLKTRDPEIALLIPIGIMLGVFVLGKSVLSQVDNHTLAFIALGASVGLCHRASKMDVAQK
jgi:O-antigen ligase